MGPSGSIHLAPWIVVSVEQLLVGLFANRVTFPVALLLVFLFRKSKRRLLRPNRITKALGDPDQAFAKNEDDDSGQGECT